MKKFLYFQPEYVSKFKCDGSKCDACCCKNWRIDIDAATYKKYSKLKPKSIAKEIISRMNFDSERGVYVITLAETKEDILWQKNFSTSSPNMLANSNAVEGAYVLITAATGRGLLTLTTQLTRNIPNLIRKKSLNSLAH